MYQLLRAAIDVSIVENSIDVSIVESSNICINC